MPIAVYVRTHWLVSKLPVVLLTPPARRCSMFIRIVVFTCTCFIRFGIAAVLPQRMTMPYVYAWVQLHQLRCMGAILSSQTDVRSRTQTFTLSSGYTSHVFSTHAIDYPIRFHRPHKFSKERITCPIPISRCSIKKKVPLNHCGSFPDSITVGCFP
jgi:hypothetical protein